jgi:hypothetical protein
MTHGARTAWRVVWLFLLMTPLIVHCLAALTPASAQKATAQSGAQSKTKSGSTKKGQGDAAPQVQYGTGKLPAPVQEMREAILGAVKTGRIEELRHAYELNELKPDLGPTAAGDPVAYWKKISGDGEGREILAALAEILETGYVVVPLGPDLENNRVYVWPYFAEVPLDKLTPPQEVELLRLVPPVVAKEMKTARKYTYWRITIGADGTWHSLRKDPNGP